MFYGEMVASVEQLVVGKSRKEKLVIADSGILGGPPAAGENAEEPPYGFAVDLFDGEDQVPFLLALERLLVPGQVLGQPVVTDVRVVFPDSVAQPEGPAFL